MTRLPDHAKPTALQAGQPTLTPADEQRIDRIADAFNQALEQATTVPTSFHNDALPTTPTIGTTPPVAQPGRPPMSQRAVDLNTTILSSSVLAAVLGGSTTAVLWASGQADPTVIGWICAGIVALPVALTAPVLAVKGLMKSAKEVAQAAPPVIHQHYSGPITQTHNTINADNRGIWAKTRNELPR
ncbi:hypothetical protein [Streptomyces collinus]|uniref:hypothetical protein n=1 Tax=Streptomyces collinus TaxID=42684 RepID=UPI0038122B61